MRKGRKTIRETLIDTKPTRFENRGLRCDNGTYPIKTKQYMTKALHDMLT